MKVISFKAFKAMCKSLPDLVARINWNGALYLLSAEIGDDSYYMARHDKPKGSRYLKLRGYLQLQGAVKRAHQAGFKTVMIFGLDEAPHPLK